MQKRRLPSDGPFRRMPVSAERSGLMQMWAQPPGERQGHQHDGGDQQHHCRHVGKVAGKTVQHRGQCAGADAAGIENAERALPPVWRQVREPYRTAPTRCR